MPGIYFAIWRIDEVTRFLWQSLVVMGSQGRGYFGELLLGGVSHAVARGYFMNLLLFLFQVGSVIVSLLVSRQILAAIVSKQDSSFRMAPGRNAVLFGVTFVIVWFAISFVAVLGWLLLHRSA